MATEHVLETLQAHQREQGLSLRALARELGVSHVLLLLLFQGRRTLSEDVGKRIERLLKAKPSATLSEALEGFIRSSAHKSARTTETLRERLAPFMDGLAAQGVQDPLAITRGQVESFLSDIARGHRGRPLSPASVFGFTKDVRAFVNFVSKNMAPDDWRNPVRGLRCKQPQVVIRPLSHAQVETLLAIAEATTFTPILKARNKAMLYALVDGALRIGELLNAMKVHLAPDGTLRVFGKGAKEREVALSPRTLAAVREYLALRQDATPFLFVAEDGKQLAYDAIKSLFHRWKKAAPTAFLGVRLSAHTLRHTSATMRRMAGMSEGDLQTFLGHSSPVMTRHYSAFALSKSANVAALRTSPITSLDTV